MLFSRCKHLIIFPLFIFSVVLTSACSTKSQQAELAAAQHRPSLADKIRENGAQIIQQGDRLQIILPTDKFFRAQSIEIKARQHHTLNLIARYLKQYQRNFHNNGTIKVSGYTDTVYLKAQRNLLSRHYAEVIAAYLWNQGFSHQQLRVSGHGAKHTIGNPRTTAGSGYNRRVMIQVN